MRIAVIAALLGSACGFEEARLARLKAAEAEYQNLKSAPERERWLVTRGEHVYLNGGDGGIGCAGCHGPEGKGSPGVFPPLVGQGEHMGDCANHARIVIQGLSKPLTINGHTYTMPMPAQPGLSDIDIAAVISYERTQWGNTYGWCAPKDVAAVR